MRLSEYDKNIKLNPCTAYKLSISQYPDVYNMWQIA